MANFPKEDVQKRISIPDQYDASARQQIGQLMVEQIRKRTANGISADGTAFRYAKKSPHKGDNLKDSGDMLIELEVVSHQPGSITIGYSNVDSIEAAQASGNQRGTYGSSTPNPALAKPFIGISSDELDLILEKVKQEAPRPTINELEESFISSILNNLGV